MNRYVSTTGTDSGPGGFNAPWASLVYAAANAQSGDNVFVLPGTYNAGAVCANNNVLYEALGVVHVVGTGYRACFDIQGLHGITIKNFDFSNAGGGLAWTGAYGIFLADVGNTSGVGPYQILIMGCTFHDINRDSRLPECFAIDIGGISYADERIPGQSNMHHIVITKCTFYPSNQDMATGMQISHVAFNGNCSDILVSECVFNHTVGMYPTDNGCIELAGNYVPSAYPSVIKRMVVRDNVLNWTGTPNTNRASVYTTGCDSILIERNVLNSWPAAMYIVTEDGPTYHNLTRNIWVRRNMFLDCSSAIWMGTFADHYLTPENIWITNNTLSKRQGPQGHLYLFDHSTLSPGGITGDCRFANNVMAGYGPYIDNLNVDPARINIDNNVASPITDRTLEAVSTDEPSWYTPGMFGPYETPERDLNGSRGKSCKGAIDCQYAAANWRGNLVRR